MVLIVTTLFMPTTLRVHEVALEDVWVQPQKGGAEESSGDVNAYNPIRRTLLLRSVYCEGFIG